MTSDPYTDPATGLLRNWLGIRDAGELARVETDVSTVALYRLQTRPLPGGYDLAHLQGFHQVIFGAVYPWAGEIRTVALAKTGMFCLPEHIASYAAEVFDHLAAEQHLRGLDRDAFLDRLTHYSGEINALHPFREGNGRTQRAFLSQLARDAGHHLAWSRLDPVRNIEAFTASLNGDDALLRVMLNDILSPDTDFGRP